MNMFTIDQLIGWIDLHELFECSYQEWATKILSCLSNLLWVTKTINWWMKDRYCLMYLWKPSDLIGWQYCGDC